MEYSNKYIFPETGCVIMVDGLINPTYTKLSKLVLEYGYSMYYSTTELEDYHSNPQNTIAVLGNIRSVGNTFYITCNNDSVSHETIIHVDDHEMMGCLPAGTKTKTIVQYCTGQSIAYIFHVFSGLDVDPMKRLASLDPVMDFNMLCSIQVESKEEFISLEKIQNMLFDI